MCKLEWKPSKNYRSSLIYKQLQQTVSITLNKKKTYIENQRKNRKLQMDLFLTFCTYQNSTDRNIRRKQWLIWSKKYIRANTKLSLLIVYFFNYKMTFLLQLLRYIATHTINIKKNPNTKFVLQISETYFTKKNISRDTKKNLHTKI